MTLAEIIEQLVSDLGMTPVEIALTLSVSSDSVERWRAGKARPRPAVEGRIRELAAQLELRLATQAASADVMRNVDTALRQVREVLHSHGRLSSRNEALDEVAVLLFAHAMGTQIDGQGVCHETVARRRGRGIADKLRDYVHGIVQQKLPTSLEHELGVADFTLRLKSAEEDLATRILDIFERLPLGNSEDPLRVDVINEAFGRFLASSFVDEKELGQYLTPPEVVDFMVRLAVTHFTDEERSALTSKDAASKFGYVLDPSCGVGSFLAEFIRVAHEEVVVPSGQCVTEWPAHAAESLVVGIDKSERMIRLALANLAIFGAPAARLHLANALATRGEHGSIAHSFDDRVGLILTNPPFGASFPYADIADYSLATKWAKRSPVFVDSELLFLERYLAWLRPGGQLLAIVPDSILTNKGLFADLRRGIAPEIQILDVVSLPTVAFAAAGTTTKTSVLHLRRKPEASSRRAATRFAICYDLGYSVSSRGSQRTKIADGTNELPTLLAAITADSPTSPIREVEGVADLDRWDATYYALMSEAVERRLSSSGVRVRDVASLSNDRIDPRRSASPTFKYIEISDVDGESCSVTHKVVDRDRTPSRARQHVRAGDVLVSTVRPERRAIGVVPTWLDGAVCTTGFAVLRPTRLSGLLLAALLRTPFVTEQLLRNNVGIAYPAIEPACLPDIMLPVSQVDCKALGKLADRLTRVRAELHTAQTKFDFELNERASAWLREAPDAAQILEPNPVAKDA